MFNIENTKYSIYYIFGINQFCLVQDYNELEENLEIINFFPLRINGRVLYNDLGTLYKEIQKVHSDDVWTDSDSVYSLFKREFVLEFSSTEEFIYQAAEYLI